MEIIRYDEEEYDETTNRFIGYLCSYSAVHINQHTFNHVPGIIFVADSEGSLDQAKIVGHTHMYNVYSPAEWTQQSVVVRDEPNFYSDDDGFVEYKVVVKRQEYNN